MEKLKQRKSTIQKNFSYRINGAVVVLPEQVKEWKNKGYVVGQYRMIDKYMFAVMTKPDVSFIKLSHIRIIEAAREFLQANRPPYRGVIADDVAEVFSQAKFPAAQ